MLLVGDHTDNTHIIKLADAKFLVTNEFATANILSVGEDLSQGVFLDTAATGPVTALAFSDATLAYATSETVVVTPFLEDLFQLSGPTLQKSFSRAASSLAFLGGFLIVGLTTGEVHMASVQNPALDCVQLKFAREFTDAIVNVSVANDYLVINSLSGEIVIVPVSFLSSFSAGGLLTEHTQAYMEETAQTIQTAAPLYSSRIVAGKHTANQCIQSAFYLTADVNYGYILLPGQPFLLRSLADPTKIYLNALDFSSLAEKTTVPDDALPQLISIWARFLACPVLSKHYFTLACFVPTSQHTVLLLCEAVYGRDARVIVLFEAPLDARSHVQQVDHIVRSVAGPQAPPEYAVSLVALVSHPELGKSIATYPDVCRLDSARSSALHAHLTGAVAAPSDARSKGPENRELTGHIASALKAAAADDAQPAKQKRTTAKPPPDEPESASQAAAEDSLIDFNELSDESASRPPTQPAAASNLSEAQLEALAASIVESLKDVPKGGVASRAHASLTDGIGSVLPGMFILLGDETVYSHTIASLADRLQHMAAADKVILRWSSYAEITLVASSKASYTVSVEFSDTHATRATTLAREVLHADAREDCFCILTSDALSVTVLDDHRTAVRLDGFKNSWKATFSPSLQPSTCALGSATYCTVGFTDGSVNIYSNGVVLLSVDGQDSGPVHTPATPLASDRSPLLILATSNVSFVLARSLVFTLYDAAAIKVVATGRLDFVPVWGDIAEGCVFLYSAGGKLQALNILSLFSGDNAIFTTIFDARDHELARIRRVHDKVLRACSVPSAEHTLTMGDLAQLAPVFYHPVYVVPPDIGSKDNLQRLARLREAVAASGRDAAGAGAGVGASASASTSTGIPEDLLIQLSGCVACIDVRNASPLFQNAERALRGLLSGGAARRDAGPAGSSAAAAQAALRAACAQDAANLAQYYPTRAAAGLRVAGAPELRRLPLNPPVNAGADYLDLLERHVLLCTVFLNGTLAFATSEHRLLRAESLFDATLSLYLKECLQSGLVGRAITAMRLFRTRRILAKLGSVVSAGGFGALADDVARATEQLFAGMGADPSATVRRVEPLPAGVSQWATSTEGLHPLWDLRGRSIGYGMRRERLGLEETVRALTRKIDGADDALARLSTRLQSAEEPRAKAGLEGGLTVVNESGLESPQPRRAAQSTREERGDGGGQAHGRADEHEDEHTVHTPGPLTKTPLAPGRVNPFSTAAHPSPVRSSVPIASSLGMIGRSHGPEKSVRK